MDNDPAIKASKRKERVEHFLDFVLGFFGTGFIIFVLFSLAAAVSRVNHLSFILGIFALLLFSALGRRYRRRRYVILGSISIVLLPFLLVGACLIVLNGIGH